MQEEKRTLSGEIEDLKARVKDLETVCKTLPRDLDESQIDVMRFISNAAKKGDAVADASIMRAGLRDDPWILPLIYGLDADEILELRK